MANWLHRTTKEYRVSNDPPLAEQGEWIRNSTLPPGCLEWSDVEVEGDVVRAPNAEELAARAVVQLTAAKSVKIAAIDARTAAVIENGSVVINGESLSTRLTQQTSLLGIKASIDVGIGTFPRALSATDGSTYECPDLADFVRISSLVLSFVESAKAAGRALRQQVLNATTMAEVNAVVDERG